MTQRISYSFFTQTVLLLVLYGGVSLLAAIKFLDIDPSSLPYHLVNALAHVILHLAVVGGLLGGGIYAAASQQSDNRLPDERLLKWVFRLWTVLVLLAVVAGILGLLEGRHLLELPPMLDIIQVIVMVLVIVAVARAQHRNVVTIVWLVGMSLGVVCAVTGMVPPIDYVQDRVLRALAVGGAWNVAYMLAAVALGYWLIRRFSDVPQVWADTGLLTVAGLLAIAGTIISLAPLSIMNDAVISIGAVIAVIFYLIYAAHSYKPLSTRNATHTLAAHWYTLAVLLVLIGMAAFGVIQVFGDVSRWTMGTRLTDTQHTLTAFALTAIILGTINQAGAELRGHNWRITGLMPFWLVTFGVICSGLVLAAAGVVQVYLERILGVGYLETQMLLTPLYVLWVVFALAIWLGLIIYALGFRARRIETIVEI